MTIKQLFKNKVKRIIFQINQVNLVKNWCNENKRVPKHTNGKEELQIYRLLSDLKGLKIYNHLLTNEYITDLRTNKEMIYEEWMNMYNKVKEYIENIGHIPKCNCVDKKMYNWIGTQKTKFKGDILSKEKIELLEKLDVL